MPSWYVLYTKPHAEHQVANALEARGIQTYLPEVPIAQPRRGRRAFKPFFPCYVFAFMDLPTLGVSQIIYTPGLRRLVMFGEREATVAPTIIERIRAHLATPQVWDQQGESLHAGDRVEILEAPFRDIEAVFDRRLSPEGRVRVFLRFLERHDVERRIAVETDLQSIRKKGNAQSFPDADWKKRGGH